MTLIMTVIVPCERLVLNDHHFDGHSFAVHNSKDNLAAALGAALAAAGLASGAVAVAVALHAAVAAVRDLRNLPTGLLKKFSEHSGVR